MNVSVVCNKTNSWHLANRFVHNSYVLCFCLFLGNKQSLQEVTTTTATAAAAAAVVAAAAAAAADDDDDDDDGDDIDDDAVVVGFDSSSASSYPVAFSLCSIFATTLFSCSLQHLFSRTSSRQRMYLCCISFQVINSVTCAPPSLCEHFFGGVYYS